MEETPSARILPLPDQRERGSDGIEPRRLHVAGRQGRERYRRASIRHVQDVDAGCDLEHLAREVGEVSGAVGRQIDLAGIGLARRR